MRKRSYTTTDQEALKREKMSKKTKKSKKKNREKQKHELEQPVNRKKENGTRIKKKRKKENTENKHYSQNTERVIDKTFKSSNLRSLIENAFEPIIAKVFGLAANGTDLA